MWLVLVVVGGCAVVLVLRGQTAVLVLVALAVAGAGSASLAVQRSEPIVVATERSPSSEVGRRENPVVKAGNALRKRVQETFDDERPSGALQVGFLIGDTERLPARDMENLRRSGLAHFVAVSGSNVALFLGAWWLIGIPFSIHPRIRAVFGIVGLGVFLVATRWEPSVVRASAMAAVPLVAGVIGVPVDGWMAIGVAVAGLLLVAPDLAHTLGFQLSVLATLGVMFGVALVSDRRPRWFWVSLAATIGAQVAVSPLILTTFGKIPLVAPLANLVAAPVVALATVAGMVAVASQVPMLVDLAEAVAAVVLGIARVAESGPQLNVVGALTVAFIGALAVVRGLRPLSIAIAVIVIAGSIGPREPWPTNVRAVVLDVGQGDAVLVQDPAGFAMLIDGGPDPRTIVDALRRYGVGRLDVVVATHGDTDHAGGLHEVLQSYEVGELWVSAFAERDEGVQALVERAHAHGVATKRQQSGDRLTTESLFVEVLGPSRRFQSDNDGSVVLVVAANKTLMVAGDIEAPAQRALPSVRPDVLLIPHHGSATSDLNWLAKAVRSEAVISYGENRYGHPNDKVVDLLEGLGVTVRHTADGDIVVPLG